MLRMDGPSTNSELILVTPPIYLLNTKMFTILAKLPFIP